MRTKQAPNAQYINNGGECDEGCKVESDQKLALVVIRENHTDVGVTGIVKAKRYSEELIRENLTKNLIYKVYIQLRNKIFA